MIKILILVSVLFGVNAFAGGDQGGGGGTGCKGLFMRSAYEVSQWLDQNGSKLNPPVNGDDFLLNINPDYIVPTSEDLQYKGQPVDVFFDGDTFQVRCDRLEANTMVGRRTVVAHETFRKIDKVNHTNFEGDDYGMSRQIPILEISGKDPIPGVCKDLNGLKLESCLQDVRSSPVGNFKNCTESEAYFYFCGVSQTRLRLKPEDILDIDVDLSGTWCTTGPDALYTIYFKLKDGSIKSDAQSTCPPFKKRRKAASLKSAYHG